MIFAREHGKNFAAYANHQFIAPLHRSVGLAHTDPTVPVKVPEQAVYTEPGFPGFCWWDISHYLASVRLYNIHCLLIHNAME